jgi:KUP system potassium uptake protein
MTGGNDLPHEIATVRSPDGGANAATQTQPITTGGRPLDDAGERTEPRPALVLLALSALGIVFGDLGTSPLYALQEAFHGSRGVAATPANVVGIVSLFIWALVLMVSVKYVAILMRAGNRGEGGILALLALLVSERAPPIKRAGWLVALALLGAAMLYGDGVITPAISVLSAVEGLRVATPVFAPYVVPITVVILIGLFAFQRFGTGRVGVVFGPVLAIWFVTIAILGVNALLDAPEILAAFNPLHGARFFAHNGWHGVLALGAVVLCLTGGEALYADMGHFGPRPIRLAWYYLALPALVLSYLGQGALLLHQPGAADRPFYSTVPSWALYPMVGLATAATIIASQALIAAVFSLTRQAGQLGYLPRAQIVQTSGSTIGQVYLPALNWALMAATLGVVITFRSSDRLAAAFGLAVSATMAITTLLFAVVARVRWRWPLGFVIIVAGGFFVADSAFVVGNVFKFMDGGWLPLIIGLAVFLAMTTWLRGQRRLANASRERSLPLPEFLASLALNPPHRVQGTAVFLAAETDGVPLVLLHHLKHNQVLHETVVLLTVTTEEVPRFPAEQRVRIEPLSLGFQRVVARYGFMEEPDVPRVMASVAAKSGVANEPNRTTYYLGRLTVVPPSERRWGRLPRWRVSLFRLLKRNERSATMYFDIPPNRVVELGTRVEL